MAVNGICAVVAGHIIDNETSLAGEGIRRLKNTQELSISPKVNDDKSYADNAVCDVATAFESADISLNKYDLDAPDESFLLNNERPTNGGIVSAAEDEGDYIFLQYKAPLRRKTKDGKKVFRYGVIYKTKFKSYDVDMKTNEGKPTLTNTPKLSGTAQATDYCYKNANGETVHPWKYEVDSDDPNCPSNIDDIWDKQLLVPYADSAEPTVTVSPEDKNTNVAVDSNVVFTFDKAINSYYVDSNNFMVAKADGTAVVGTLSLDSTNKIVTFKPTVNLTAAASYIAIISGNVKSSTGIALGTGKITTFTTA